jgi:hypothetical protein
MGGSTSIPPHHEVVYSFRANGTIEMRIVGPRRYELLYPALALAAQYAFMYARPILVMENGLPFRLVEVHRPRSV